MENKSDPETENERLRAELQASEKSLERLRTAATKAAFYLQIFGNGAERAAHDVLIKALENNEKKTEPEADVKFLLRRLAEIWPETLMLFAGDGKLYLMRMMPNGEPPIKPNGGGYDQKAIIMQVDIPADGGGW